MDILHSINENPGDSNTKIKMFDISTNSLWLEGRNFLKNIVEYNTRSRKQTKIEIDHSFLNSCDKRIVKIDSYLVTSKKKKNIQNITDKKNFSTLKKLLIITLWVLWFMTWQYLSRHLGSYLLKLGSQLLIHAFSYQLFSFSD